MDGTFLRSFGFVIYFCSAKKKLYKLQVISSFHNFYKISYIMIQYNDLLQDLSKEKTINKREMVNLLDSKKKKNIQIKLELKNIFTTNLHLFFSSSKWRVGVMGEANFLDKRRLHYFTN